MRIYTILIMLICLFTSYTAELKAQTPSDAVMMPKRELCLALMYDNGQWDKYWEGTFLRSNATVGTLSRHMIMPMLAIGIHEKVNLIIATPYVKAASSEPNGGFLASAKGFQDLGIHVKAKLVEKELGPGKLSFLTNAGFSTPMSNYLSDYGPYSLGFGAIEWNMRGIARYKLNNGLFVQGALAHLWRGQTEAERDYYYNNGSYYTSFMDVPNAWNYHIVAGAWLFDNSLRLEANYMSLASTSGDDIRPYNMGQPTNKVEFAQAGFMTQYYFKQVKGLGVLAYYSQVVSGRNMGKFRNLGVGITYQFKV